MAEKEKNCTALKILCPLLVLAILVPSVLDGNAQCMPAKIAENLIEESKEELKCKSCGTELNENNRFCPNCGESVNTTEE